MVQIYTANHNPHHIGEKETALRRIHALAVQAMGPTVNLDDARFEPLLREIARLTECQARIIQDDDHHYR
jgi:hypothetical protein